jgi:hypothetical protein
VPLDPVAYHPYADPDDFTREVTDRIWVERDIAHIVENYEPDSVVHVGLGTLTSRAEVIEGSTMRMAMGAITNPTAQPGQAEDVVWEARGEDGFLSSHLILRSEERFADGSAHWVQSRSVANCLYRRGRMVQEWIARDSLAPVLQRGRDPASVAADLTFRGYAGSFASPPPSDVLAEGDSGPRTDEYRAECEMVLELIHEAWNQRNFRKVHDLTERDLFLHSIGERIHLRRNAYQAETLRLLAAFPNAVFEVRDVQTNFNERYAGLRIAVLWKMVGRYEGQSLYGPVTDAPVNLLGISQFLVQGGRITRERRIYDEIALRAQINAARGDEPRPSRNIYYC